MSFRKIANDYLAALQKEVEVAELSGEATPELSFRTSLDTFFKKIAEEIDPKIVVILEPKNQHKRGRPDWRFHNADTMGVYGYIEGKSLDPNVNLNPSEYKDQTDKYLSLGNPIILTDGIEFVVYKPNGAVRIFSLCRKPIVWDAIDLNLETEVLFKEFFRQEGYREISENRLVAEVARRTRLLRDDLIEFLNLDYDEAENDSELQTLHLLKDLHQTAAMMHDKTLLANDPFASFIAQILAFGLLYAHRIVDRPGETPAQKYKSIHDFWFSCLYEGYANRLIPFKTLVRGLEMELNSHMSRLGLWYDDLRRLLSYVRLTKQQIEMPDFHELYESFLKAYDPDARFDYGAFYTPRSLAFYMVTFANEIMNRSFGDITTDNSKIIDPCCGTGTFIEAIISQSAFVDPKIIGFEILPAPYALAHYRMTMLNKGYPQNVRIVLTNTLSDNIIAQNYSEDDIGHTDNLLLQEQYQARDLSNPPITLIIGNPPSSDSKFIEENEGQTIKLLIEDFRPPESARRARQNTQKQLSNEFVKFLRWTTEKALQSKPSIFILILPSSFAKHASYKYARKYLVERFDELFVLEFDGDNRKGTRDSNVFQTLQGRLILAGTYGSNISLEQKVKYKSIVGLPKNKKIDFFGEQSIDLSKWERLNVGSNNGYALKPVGQCDEDLYSKFWPIWDELGDGIFARKCSSLKLAPTHLLIHASPGQLKRRSKYIADGHNNYDDIKRRWYEGQLKPPPRDKITPKVREALQKAVTANNIVPYSYRPFVDVSVVLSDEILNELRNLGGGGTRDRPEIRNAFQNPDVLGFAVSPAPEDIGSVLHKFLSFCWNIPDNDLTARGNANIFCNYFPENKTKKKWDRTNKTNVNSQLISVIASAWGLSEKEVVDDIVYYAYGVLNSNYYMKLFHDKLFTTAGVWPRIPISQNKESFLKITDVGRQLAHLEKSKQNESIPNSEPYEPFVYYKYKQEDQAIILLDQQNREITRLNNIADSVLSFTVSGYNVLKEWLKLHSYPYFRKELSNEDFSELKGLIVRIGSYLNLIKEVDDLVKPVIVGNLFVAPSSD